jgi:hypothetical protein
MGDPLTEGLTPAPLRIHVMGKEVAGMPGVKDDVRFRDRPS